MSLTLEDMIKQEYDLFYVDQKRQSKDGIYSNASRIATIGAIYKELLSVLGELDERTALALSWQEDLLQSAYRFYQDNNYVSTSDFVWDWIEYVVDGVIPRAGES